MKVNDELLYDILRNGRKELTYEEVIEIIKDLTDRGYKSYRKAKEIAIKACEKQIAKKVVIYSDDGSADVYCPNCNKCIGHNEMVYDDFYYRGWIPMYCQECGQAIIW